MGKKFACEVSGGTTLIQYPRPPVQQMPYMQMDGSPKAALPREATKTPLCGPATPLVSPSLNAAPAMPTDGGGGADQVVRRRKKSNPHTAKKGAHFTPPRASVVSPFFNSTAFTIVFSNWDNIYWIPQRPPAPIEENQHHGDNWHGAERSATKALKLIFDWRVEGQWQ